MFRLDLNSLIFFDYSCNEFQLVSSLTTWWGGQMEIYKILSELNEQTESNIYV